MKVFLTGATGYIGGTVAVRLREAGHQVVGLVRDSAKAGALAASGVEPVVGSLDDSELLTEQARRADGVINAANSDHRAAVEALRAGLEGSGKPFVHTSGSGVVGDDARGERNEQSYGDDIHDPGSAWRPEHPIRVARAAIHRVVLDSAEAGIRSSVLCPAMIYGHGLGPARNEVHISALVEQARHSGVVRHAGAGRNIWSTVHVEDLADLYLLALERSPAGTFYFVENGEESLKGLAASIAEALGLDGPAPWDIEAAGAFWGPQFTTGALASNSRVRATRARDVLGWKPRHGSVTEWIAADLTL
ncbi:NAD-dependent epimerase/dehydratase family protein [Streptomyces xiangluensis]|uniref:NAD-dependent epimerase/dehydratase family protein n=1 Tax=Streptomyces xiangluensis TaxID=2665720 RepID=A0ABV8YJM7_9ACTN